MTENLIDELLLEHLKAKVADDDAHSVRLENELRAIKTHLAARVRRDLNRHGDLTTLAVHVERIERRLNSRRQSVEHPA
jgi:hypothetical protein